MRRPFLTLSNHFPYARFVAINLADSSNSHHRQLVNKFGVTHVPTVFFATAAPSADRAAQMLKVKYDGAPRIDPLRTFIEQQLESVQQLQQEKYGTNPTQKTAPPVQQDDKEL